MKNIKTLPILAVLCSALFFACSEKPVLPKEEAKEPLKTVVYDKSSIAGVLNYMAPNFLDGSGQPPSGIAVKTGGYFWGDINGSWGCNNPSSDATCLIAYINEDGIDIVTYGLNTEEEDFDITDENFPDFIVAVDDPEPKLYQCKINSYTLDSVGNMLSYDFTLRP